MRTFLNGNFACLNGEGMIWRVRRLSGSSGETSQTLTASYIDNMNVSTFENKLISEVEA